MTLRLSTEEGFAAIETVNMSRWISARDKEGMTLITSEILCNVIFIGKFTITLVLVLLTYFTKKIVLIFSD